MTNTAWIILLSISLGLNIWFGIEWNKNYNSFNDKVYGDTLITYCEYVDEILEKGHYTFCSETYMKYFKIEKSYFIRKSEDTNE